MAKGTRNIELILYDIDDVYRVKKICNDNNYDYAYIFHNMDVKDDLSDFKKEHYHFQLYSENQKTYENWSKFLGVPIQYIQQIHKKSSAIRYLIHADNNDKFQYNIEDIQCNMEIIRYFTQLVSDETNEMDIIISYISYANRHISYKELMNYVLDNNCWSTYRRNYAIIKDYLYEHNTLVTNRLT